MPASGRFMNWTGVSFTPAGTGLAIPINEVTNVQTNDRVTLRGASGDADTAPSAKTLEYMDPQITITTEALALIATIPPGARGTLTYTHNDFYNGSGTGAMIHVVSNAIRSDAPHGGAHRATGSSTLTFETFAPDGVSSPIAYTFAP
jgi:hypothetical protein